MAKYSDEENVQILIALMKKHGIRKIVASPGTTNIGFVASVQSDTYFEIFSSVDERSAAYIACGIAAESGEAVALSCTGATASRNYMSGLTEAYYRKLPVLAITSAQHVGRIGQNIAQVIDRSVVPNDIAKLSITSYPIYSDEDRWASEIQINKALLELHHNGGGPVHINLITTYSDGFSSSILPEVKKITRYNQDDIFPNIENKKVVVVVGNHKPWSENEITILDRFCELYDAIVICDHTSKYTGRYKALGGLVATQRTGFSEVRRVDILINIGDVSAAYLGIDAKEMWRVNPDGELRDSFKCLTAVFQMEESIFFGKLNKLSDKEDGSNSYYKEFMCEKERLEKNIPELPFSNCWIAQHLIKKLQHNSSIHFGILNSFRTWNFFDLDNSISAFCNTGGFGIDGCVSSLIGAALCNENKIFYGVVGDLAFFYDMNVLGNRHIGNNIRLLVVNNGNGTEFKNFMHPAYQFGEKADNYISAAGHYGNQSRKLVKHYAEDLGFKYIQAESKQEFLSKVDEFNNQNSDKSIIFEVFTTSEDESDALRIMYNLDDSGSNELKGKVRKIIGEKNYDALRKVVKRN